MEIPPCCADLMHSHLRKFVTPIMCLLIIVGSASGEARSDRVFFGDASHPVVSGEVWLIANRWGAYPGVLVATIQSGKLEAHPSVQFPPYWEQAFDYKLLVAVADQYVGPPASLVEDFAYDAVGRPDYVKHFSTIYLSSPLAAAKLGKDWPSAFQQMGQVSGSDLILPVPARRTIRLLYPDGRPLVGAQVPIALYGSSENHCDVPVGIWLGVFTSDAAGEVAVVAPKAQLALSIRHFEVKAGGPAGKAFFWHSDVIIGGEPTIVRELWTLPQHDYVLRLRTARNQPIAHAHLTGCDNFDGCGVGCGPMRAPQSDTAGMIRFRAQDLRDMRSITVVSAEGKERVLTDAEMQEMLTSYQLNLRWD